MENEFNLESYLGNGIENIVKKVIKSSLKNPKESAFVLKYALASKEAKKKRINYENNGEHIPVFLMASITSNCNLFCKGCFARANNYCGETKRKMLSSEKWEEIFNEAKELGVAFIILLGGEPLMRKDVIEKASKIKDIVFPVFTNGTMINDDYFKLFNDNRNLVPMLSIEGNMEETDERRGEGTYNNLVKVMKKFKDKGILFGASITITTKNIGKVTSLNFVSDLYEKGCKAITFVEYVPVTEESRSLAPTDGERIILEKRQMELREKFQDIVILSFPGDEKYSGGCIAAGRGFFHINIDGAAEPCPFAPFSDITLENSTLREALKSKLFKELDATGMLEGEHDGGCLLFYKKAQVQELIKEN
ncbi:MAG: radical SAM protein [Clostridium perfringens]|nr:radical SAM protein [Clostridium perfringens]